MHRTAKNLFDWPILNDLAGIHHRQAVGHAGNRTNVVADVQHRHTEVLLKFSQQVKDMGLSRNVEASRRLVKYKQLGRSGQTHGDGNPLQLTTRELVGIPTGELGHLRQVHLGQQLQQPFTQLRSRKTDMDRQDLRDLIAHPHGGRQG